MPALHPTGDQFRALRDDPHSGPIAQVNLLKFRPTAAYTDTEVETTDETGEGAYDRYVNAFTRAAAEVGGTCILYGKTERYFIGQGDWDAVLVMQFPNRQAFIETLNHPTYADMHRHRDAGLLCQELITTRI